MSSTSAAIRKRSCAAPLAVAITMLSTTLTASPSVDPAIAARLRTLDCSRVDAAEVAEILAASPAPRIIALQGSLAIVTMEPFAAFLEAMGYPGRQLVNPIDGKLSYSSFVDSRRLAGTLAWHYEQDALMPMLIGHSQGGMIVIKVLHDLAGTEGKEPIPVWNPARSEPESRTTIVDPLSSVTRPVVGLQVDYAAALATGSLPRLLLGQWGILSRLREVPDSAVDFTGFAIPWDLIAGTGADPPRFLATGTARVRNVVLPSSYSHIALPSVGHLAAQPVTRGWIERYHPDAATMTPVPSGADTSNLLHAADIWYSVKRHWCLGAQRLLAVRGAFGVR